MIVQERDIQRANQIDGWMSLKELMWLAEIASKSNTIVEIGSYKGRSTRALLDNCKGLVYAVDPWNGAFYREDGSVEFIADTNLMHQFLENTKDCNNLTIFRGEFDEFLDRIELKVDFIFIDGCHLYNSVKKDINNALKIIKLNGIIACHDYTQEGWPGVRKAFNEFFPSSNIIESIGWVRL